MTIRTILVNLDVDGPATSVLQCAANLAERFGASLIGLCAAEPSSTYVGLDGGAVAAEWYGEERKQIEERLTQVRELFRTSVPTKVRTEFRSFVDTPTHSLVGAARAADLIVAGTPAASTDGYGRAADLGELVLTSGRPLLIPGAGVTEIMGDRIVVGWKDTREARRAASDALPLLLTAKDVRLVGVNEGDYATEKVALDDAVAWLTRHGVSARGEIWPTGDSPATALEQAATEMGADLVVSGGYGHSRMRELLFGGVTRELLGYKALSRFVSN